MPALIVLQVISSSPGFSRKRLMFPRASVSTSPYARGLSTGVSTIVALAFRSRCSCSTAARSTWVSTSPLKTTTDSVSESPAYRIAPPVPSGIGSTT